MTRHGASFRRALFRGGAVIVALTSLAPVGALAAGADTSDDVQKQLLALKSQLEAQQQQLSRDEAELNAQRAALAEQAKALDAARPDAAVSTTQIDELLGRLRAEGYNVIDAGAANSPAPPAASTAAEPVGEPPPPPRKVIIGAVPQEATVLTQRGHFSWEPTAEYTITSANILVFQGVEIVPGIQLGVITASNTSRALEALTPAVRYGLTDRLELNASVPYVWRQDRMNVTQQRDQQVTTQISLTGAGIGDAQFGLRYQINELRPNRPVFIAGVEAKADTGSDPYLVPRDQYGIETTLATGSGFWGIQPSLTVLYPTDPAILFGTLSYMYNVPKTYNQTISGVLLNRVNPGGTMAAGFGFGFAVNPNFSYSVAFKYNYIAKTEAILGGSSQWSSPLQVGTVVLGMAYALRPGLTINAQLEVGVTADAPNTHLTIQIPFS